MAAVLGQCVISAVTVAEVASKFAREHAPPDLLRESVAAIELEVVALCRRARYAIGDLAPVVPRHGLSLGDRACLALARELRAPALTWGSTSASSADARGKRDEQRPR